jgi:SAM-dependent methyltransferase
MPGAEKRSSRELGLVLAQQLLGVEDLHYGLWDPDLALSLANIPVAQQRYTRRLLELLEHLLAGLPRPRVLDVGCGTGHMLEQMLERGFEVDAVNPSAHLNEQVRKRQARMNATSSRLFETGFESFPVDEYRHHYDLLLFSESFQYIPLPEIFANSPRLLKTGGRVVICDFFKTAAHCDGEAGDRSFSGGHILSEFYRRVGESSFEIERDEDLTKQVSPNIALLDEWLTRRLVPAAGSIDLYLQGAYPKMTRLMKWLLRRKLERVRYKYLSGNRSQAVFEKYKSYRLIVLRHGSGG